MGSKIVECFDFGAKFNTFHSDQAVKKVHMGWMEHTRNHWQTTTLLCRGGFGRNDGVILGTPSVIRSDEIGWHALIVSGCRRLLNVGDDEVQEGFNMVVETNQKGVRFHKLGSDLAATSIVTPR